MAGDPKEGQRLRANSTFEKSKHGNDSSVKLLSEYYRKFIPQLWQQPHVLYNNSTCLPTTILLNFPRLQRISIVKENEKIRVGTREKYNNSSSV